MKTLLKLEELAMFLLSAFALYTLPVFKWWWYLLLLLGPDISMLGYLVNNKVGAVSYNFFHHKGIAVFFILLTFLFPSYSEWGVDSSQVISEYFLIIGIVLFGHSSIDRFFGFGLKYTEGFKFTHLGKIGKEKDENI